MLQLLLLTAIANGKSDQLKNFTLIKLAKSSSKCSNSKIKYVFENESNMEFHVDFRISFGPFSNFVTAVQLSRIF